MKKYASIYKPFVVEGDMKIDVGIDSPVIIELKISRDCRVMDVEKLFNEIQETFIKWTRPKVSCLRNEKYVVDHSKSIKDLRGYK